MAVALQIAVDMMRLRPDPSFYPAVSQPESAQALLPHELQSQIDAAVDALREDTRVATDALSALRRHAANHPGPLGDISLLYAEVLSVLRVTMTSTSVADSSEQAQTLLSRFHAIGEWQGCALALAAQVVHARSVDDRQMGLRIATGPLTQMLARLPQCAVRVMAANTCGVAHSDNEQLEAAANCYYTALRDAQALGLHAREAHISANIGEMLYMSGNAADARLLLERAAELSKLAPGAWLSTFVATTLALCRLAQGQAQEAKASIASLLDASDDTLGPSLASRLWFLATAALVLAECGELRAAQRHAQRGHELWPLIAERQLSPYIWWASGRLLRLQGDTTEAIHHFEEAISASANSGYAFMPMNAAREVFEILQQQADLQGALIAHQRFHSLYERVHNQSARLSLQLLRTQSQLVQAQREAEQHLTVARVKSRFIAMASHEFRTPLSAIQSSVELLRYYADRMEAQERESLWASLDTSFARLKTTMEQVLLLAKSEEDKLPVRLQELDWHAAAVEVSNEVQMATARRNPIQIVCPDAVLLGTRLRLDLNLFRQALSNLMTNACKYSGEGQSIEVRCSRQTEANASWLRLDVIDHGLGIHADDHERLFSSFERGRNTEHISGTGLGLAIVRRAMDALGGEVSFVSEIGRGSTFTLRFPIGALTER